MQGFKAREPLNPHPAIREGSRALAGWMGDNLSVRVIICHFFKAPLQCDTSPWFIPSIFKRSLKFQAGRDHYLVWSAFYCRALHLA